MTRTAFLIILLFLSTMNACSKHTYTQSQKSDSDPNQYSFWLVSSNEPTKLEQLFHECAEQRPKIVKQDKTGITILASLNYLEVQRLKSQGLHIEKYTKASNNIRSLQTRQFALGNCQPPYNEPAQNTFCGYTEDIERCDVNISNQLQNYANNASFAEIVNLGNTHEGRELLGIRIGNLTSQSDPASPQVVLIGTQHGDEIIAAEISMRLIKYFHDAYINNTDGIQTLLQDRTLTIVPVANPDGYDYWHLTGSGHRANKNPCMGNPFPGVDLNRNHTFDWALGVNSIPGVCFDLRAAGTFANSEPETQGLTALIGHDTSILPGNYKTGVMATFHSPGGIIGYPPGVDANRNICALNHKPSIPPYTESKANCTPPDQDILNEAFGTQRPGVAFLKREDLNNRIPYDNGSKGRVFNYGISGSISNTALYGPMNGTTLRTLSALIELTKVDCVGRINATRLSADQLDVMESDAVAMVLNLLQKVPALANGTHLSSKLGHKFALPHIYRIKTDVEHPKLRYGAKNEVVNPQVQAPSGYVGTSQQDITIPGVHYTTWYWQQNDPDNAFEYPNELRLCVNEGACATVRIDDGPVDLCSQAGWTVSNWTFIGRQTVGPSNQCYWKLTNNPGILTRRKVDLTQMMRSRLVFSYDLDWEAAGSSKEMRVYVSNNGFVNCSTEEGTGCRLIETYYEMENDGRTGESDTLRTEMFDVSDFDGQDKVQVRFVVNNGNEGSASLYDVHFIGWKTE